MQLSKVIEILEKLAPRSLAMDWDNPGFLCGRKETEVKKILLTLDVDDRAVKTAAEQHADLILSHHPLIFSPLKHVTDEDFIGRRLVTMIRHDIACFAMHTNFDAAPGCMADLASERIGLTDVIPLLPMGEIDGVPVGIGKTGNLRVPMTGEELGTYIKKQFDLPSMTVYGTDDWQQKRFTRVSVCPGSGRGEFKDALEEGAEVLITGDIGHHEGIDAAAQGLTIMDAGHYGLEHIFMDYMEGYLKKNLGDEVELFKMPIRFPSQTI